MSGEEMKPFPEASPETVWLMYEMNGGIIATAELATKIGEALCEAHYGGGELQRQRPLTVADRGTYWRVEGSRNRDGKIDGPGAFFLSIQKRDGLILDLGQRRPYFAHPSVKPIIEPYLQQKKAEEGE